MCSMSRKLIFPNTLKMQNITMKNIIQKSSLTAIRRIFLIKNKYNLKICSYNNWYNKIKVTSANSVNKSFSLKYKMSTSNFLLGHRPTVIFIFHIFMINQSKSWKKSIYLPQLSIKLKTFFNFNLNFPYTVIMH